MIFRPIFWLVYLWKLVWNVAFLHLCTTTVSPEGGKSKFWLGRVLIWWVLIHDNHLGASGQVKIKSPPLFFAHFFHPYGGNCHFWSTISHFGAQRPKNQNPCGGSSSFMPLMEKNHMRPHGMAHTKLLHINISLKSWFGARIFQYVECPSVTGEYILGD